VAVSMENQCYVMVEVADASCLSMTEQGFKSFRNIIKVKVEKEPIYIVRRSSLYFEGGHCHAEE
jgi:hypothetical protein